MESNLEKKQRVNLLMDCYEELLTDKQKEYLMLVLWRRFSLAEIAEDLDVSRNAVYDNLKRAVASLEDYEKKLHLLEKQYSKNGFNSKDWSWTRNIKRRIKWLFRNVKEDIGGWIMAFESLSERLQESLKKN